MPSLSERHRNNVKAGLFVSVSLLLGLAVLIVLGDVFENLSRSVDAYTVTFDVKTGVGNLKKGSDVRVGGVKQGKVLEVDLEPEPGQPLRTIEVKFEINDHIKLFSDAEVLVMAPLIGADGWLEIPDVGSSNQPPLNGIITGVSTPALLTGLLGSEKAELLDQIFSDGSATMASIRNFTDGLPNLDGEYERRVVPILEKVNNIATNTDEVVTDFHANKWPKWSQALDEALDNAARVTGDVKAMVEDNRARIDSFIADAEGLAHELNSETVKKANQLLDKGTEGLESAKTLLNDLRMDYPLWATDITDGLASVNLAAQQLKLATIEIRHSPWKLLYRPQPKEEEYELLYDATRNFALAAADLKTASVAVRRIIEQPVDGSAPLPLDQATVERLQKHLLDSLNTYQTAQQQLMDVLLTEPPQPK
jgi:ABC-type transporter Mla subunit MlaD